MLKKVKENTMLIIIKEMLSFFLDMIDDRYFEEILEQQPEWDKY